MTSPRKPWFADGLQFSCRECHACCYVHGENRWVYLTTPELESMARALSLSGAEFGRRYCLEQSGQVALRFETSLCPLHDNQAGCTVYQARPLQCATWPWWPENLYSRRAWEANVVSFCPGARGGRLWSAVEILQLLHRQRG